jgi:single-strand DNA-binding protein
MSSTTNPALKEESMSTTPPNVNTVTLVGQLTADPELRSLPDGRSVCDLRMAVNDQRDQPPLFIDVATFGAAADACAAHLTKGRAVAVTGRLVYREWEKDGVKRSRHHIVGRVAFGSDGRSADNHVAGGEKARDE